jgi:hypothetical protein
LVLNNTTDESLDVAQACCRMFHDRLSVEIDLIEFPPFLAHVGSARRRAMEIGLSTFCGSAEGVLLTTDADCKPPPHWVSANLKAIAAGADLVGGRILIDESEPVPAPLLSCCRLWDAYWERVCEIENRHDPLPWDPAPRHRNHSGASLGMKAAAYRRAGGIPTIPTGEDIALVNAVAANGGKIVHPLDVWVCASPRRQGRAPGGMAQTLTDRYRACVTGLQQLAPALHHWRARASWRQQRRMLYGNGRVAQDEAQLPPMPADTPLGQILQLPVVA